MFCLNRDIRGNDQSHHSHLFSGPKRRRCVMQVFFSNVRHVVTEVYFFKHSDNSDNGVDNILSHLFWSSRYNFIYSLFVIVSVELTASLILHV